MRQPFRELFWLYYLLLSHKKIEATNSRIIGGQDAPIDRYPYVVSIQRLEPKFDHSCGGSLIAPDIVLSAAHCYLDPDVAAIRTDPYRLDDPLPDSSILRVKEIVLHPDRTNYDIMIIKMWDSVDLPLLHVNENPDQPVKGQILASAGWGTTQFGEDKPPEVLQYTDRLVYLTNEECINITLANPYENYNGSITDNELCALEAGTGSCQGDSGGPLIIPGSTAEEDLLVGIVSWGYDCAVPIFPGVFARISRSFQFVRTQVCSLSEEPPEYFLCNEPYFTSPPSALSIPTSSPAPSGNPVDVLIRIKLDGFPIDTGWSLKDSATGRIVHQVEAGGYDLSYAYATVETYLTLTHGDEYFFLLTDAHGDGICCGREGSGNVFIFLGNTTDYKSLLLFFDGASLPSDVISMRFTASEDAVLSFQSPSSSPTDSPLPSLVPTATNHPTGQVQDVTLVINFDTYSAPLISWLIFTPDGHVVKQASQGTYDPFQGDVVSETFSLELGLDYVFIIRDSGGDGICCAKGLGYVKMYYGVDIQTDEVLLYDRGDFGFERSHNFTVSIEATFVASQSPSVAPSFSMAPSTTAVPTAQMIDITVEIKLDYYSHESGWSITSIGGDFHVEYPTGFYRLEPSFSVIREIVKVPAGREFVFRLTDAGVDGLCCFFGKGFAIVYLGNATADTVLLFMDGKFRTEQFGIFVASEDGILSDFTPVPSLPTTIQPTRTAPPSPVPSISPAPSSKISEMPSIDLTKAPSQYLFSLQPSLLPTTGASAVPSAMFSRASAVKPFPLLGLVLLAGLV